MREPPNLHLHSFQRISREWNGEASKVQSLSFGFLAVAGKKASSELTTSSPFLSRHRKEGSERGAEWRPRGRGPLLRVQTTKSFLRGYAARPLKSRKPEKQPRAALETSRRRPLVDKGAASSIKRHVGENIRGKMHRASMWSLEKRFLAANRKSLRARLSSFLLSAK